MVVQDKPYFRDVTRDEPETNDRKQRLRERFEVVKKLGQGTYGKVQLAVNKESKQEVAIKTIKKVKIENEQDLVRIRREIQIMSSIHHPHITHIYEVFENQEKIVLIMQYASGGELYDYLGCRKKFDENEARRVFRQVASAIYYCHKNLICHRDLKLENILLDDRGNAKIADFGLSNVFDERFKLKTFCGSPLYASPEIVRGTPYCGPEVDCWSLGVLLYTLVYGAMPFDGSNFKRLVKQISEGEYFEPKEKSGASGLIRRLLTVDINHRATIRDICSDRWVNQGYDHSLLKVASDMANLTPVRLDLLLALSSSQSHAADQSVQKQTITTIQPAEKKDVLCNGYYSKSHPLRAPENSEGRKKIVAEANECYSYNAHTTKDIRKQYGFSAVSSAKEEPTEHRIVQERLPLEETKRTPTANVPTTDKNESNTLIIVQDLIQEVISKVERHINTSKMELRRTTTTRQTQEKVSLDSCSSPTCKENAITDGIKKHDDPTNLLTGTQKSESQDSGSKDGLLRQNRIAIVAETEKVLQDSQPRGTPSVKNTVGLNTAIGESKTANVFNGINEADTECFLERNAHVQKDIFGERRKSIPSKNADLQSRKDSIQLMEPDFVIPIFNVCSNIPKRSSDSVKFSSNDSKLKEAFRSPPFRLNKPDSGATDSDAKSSDEQLLKGKGKDTVCSSNASIDKSSKNSCKDFISLETVSQESTCLNETTVQGTTFTSETVSGSAGVDTKECPSQTEAPKLPPRKRFLIKIPKQGQSNEKDVGNKSDDSHKIPISDKAAFPEEKGTSAEIQKQEHQMVDKSLSVAPVSDDKEKRPSLCSEDDASLTANKAALDAESSPKLSQRKSRRDSSKRSQLLNAKTGMNRESGHTTSEKPNCTVMKTECPEINADTSAKELNDSYTPNAERQETTEILNDVAQFSEGQAGDSSNGILEDAIHSGTDDENGSLNLQKYFEMLALLRQREMLETEVKNTRNDSLQETEKCIRYEAHEVTQSKPLGKPKQRSLSRTRAMSMEFESLALMPVKIVGPPKKPPGKVEIPKTFDPTQPVTSPKAEMKEIIFIPTACVSENKEKIQKKIEKVKKAAIVIPPRRKSDAGVASRKKKYTRSKTDFIPRSDDLADLAMSTEDGDLVTDETQQDSAYQDAMLQNEETSSLDNMDGETVPNEMWYSAVSPDTESEECVRGDNFDGFYNENDVTTAQNRHRHSVDTESGYWTPPEMTSRERCVNQTRMKDEKIARKYDNSEKIMLQRAAFRNSKLRMKLSDEGLDMCSLSSSLESGIYSLRQEDVNGKRISPDSESALKVLSSFKFADGSYAPIARSFKKMTFPPDHSSTSELSENCSMVGDAEKNVSVDAVAFGKDGLIPQCAKPNGMDSKPIKPSDSQSSYGSNDISDDVFESWVDKEDVAITSKEKYEQTEDNANSSTLKTRKTNKKARNWQRGDTWHSYSTDKESSDNDDDLDLMVDESHQGVYGTEGLWQFLKSVNEHLSNQLKTAAQKVSAKPVCHRSKSQESKHPDDVMNERRPATRSLSREERKGKGDSQLRHFVSEGKLANADSIDCFGDTYTRLNDTRYSSGYMASGSSLEDSGLIQKDFMSSVDSFQNYSDDVSLYGTLRRDKYFHSSSALSSPCITRRKKSLQNLHSSGDLSSMYDNAEAVDEDELLKYSAEQNRKLSLYGTLRPKHLSQQGRAQSQILLSTNDGYQLMYNERLKKDPGTETRYGSLGTLGSSGTKASSEINVSKREHQLKDYEKLLLSETSASHRNTSNADSSYHTVSDKPTSRVKKIVSDKGMRRVSFSNDVKSSKSDYHSSLRLNSLNKVREANEELLNSTNHKNNVYEDEPDSGSLLEALKTYGYRGIMSQKLQSSPDKYEPPRLNYRLPTECFLSTGLSTTGWDDFEYMPVENTLAYQQQLYSPLDTMEYYQSKTFAKGSQMKKNIVEYTDLPYAYDDDSLFKDIYRSHRLGESDVVSRRKPVHKLQDLNDLHSGHSDRYVGETWDSKHVTSTRKKGIGSVAMTLSNERRNSGSEKMIQRDRDRNGEEAGTTGSTDISEHRISKKTENPIEVLSEKIQALKSRCQKKSLDESRLKKELDDSGILPSEGKDCEKTAGLEVENEKHGCFTDTDEATSTQEIEPSESVSDRIWRKSFYSRFNDVSTVRRKKSSLVDADYLSSRNILRSAGKFNVDEEGGVEEPWLSTSLKRRNSNFRRSLPKQTMVRASSLNSDTKAEYADCSARYYKKGALESDSEYKGSFVPESKSLSQSNSEEQGTLVVCDNLLSTAKREVENRTVKNLSNSPQNKYSPDSCVLLQGNTGGRMDSTELGSPVSSKSSLADASPNKFKCERKESIASGSEPAKDSDNIPETQRDLTNGGCTADTGVSNISAPELKNETSSSEDSVSKSGNSAAQLNNVTDETLEHQREERNSTKFTPGEIIDPEKQCDRLESNKE